VWAGAQVRCGLVSWAAYGLYSNTPIDYDESTADPASFTLTTVRGGFAVGYAFSNDGSGGSGFAWTNLSKRIDETVESTVGHSGADAVADDSSLAVTCNHAGTNANRVMVAASF
jgi:hypothetical protein